MIYANYAATSPALSKDVVKELCEYASGTHLNAARNFEGLEAGTIALRARRAIAKLFNAPDPLKVIFTSGATQSLNMAINGLLRPGDHVLTTMIEHNAVARTLEALHKNGIIELDWLTCAPDGSLDPQTIRNAVRKNTRALVMSHASNVLGTILPITECVTIAREYNIFTIVDAAQTAGVVPLAMDCDVIAFTGHKGLGALAGVGGLVLGDTASREMRPWLRGGTGSASKSLDMPAFLPDKFEPGTQNTIGILSLAVSVEEILRTSVQTIREQECALMKRFLEGLKEIQTVTLHGIGDSQRSVALVSVTVKDHDPAEVSRSLFENHGIITRSGLHCAPLAHKTAGTYPSGTVRFSFGSGTTDEDITAILAALSTR